MVKDRLAELKQISARYKAGADSNDVSTQIEVDPEQKKILQVLDRFAEITSWINAIKQNVEEMRAIIFGPSFHYNDRGLRSQMEERIADSLKNCKQIHSAIKEVEEEEDGESDLSTLSRIKRIQFLLTKDYYIRTFREHEDFLRLYDERIKKIAQREAKIMSVTLNEEETESLLTNNGNQCFVGNVLEETEKCRLELRDLIVRHKELENLENSLIEVRDLFLKISTLVMEQGALIQVVEFHAQEAALNVEYGADKLEGAREKKIAALKKKYCLLIWVVSILSFLIVILLFAP